MIIFNNKSYLAGISTLSDGDMTIGSRERDSFIARFSHTYSRHSFLKQTHSKTVFWTTDIPDCAGGIEGDGLLSIDPAELISVTVADCMPIYIFAFAVDKVKNANVSIKGILHSGSKGTGILEEALKMIYNNNQYVVDNLKVGIGPHIGRKDYAVDKARWNTFKQDHKCDFSNGRDYCIDMLQANLNILHKYRIRPAWISGFSTFSNGDFASFRRQGPDNFTRMIAFIR